MDTSFLKGQIRAILDSFDQLPPINAPTDETSQKYDPTSFSKTKPVKDALDRLTPALKQCLELADGSPIPETILEDGCIQLNNLRNTLGQVLNYIRKQEGPAQVSRPQDQAYQDQAKAISKYGGQFSQLIKPWLENEAEKQANVLRTILQDVEAATINLEETKAQSFEALDKLKEQTDHKIAYLERQTHDLVKELTTKTKEAAATVLSEVNIEELNDSIKSHEKSAKYWLRAFIISCLFAFRLLVWVSSENDNLGWPFPWFNVLTHPMPTDPTLAQALTGGLGKILVVSFGLGLCILSGRIYQTHWHNSIVNRQRRMALISYLKLYSAVSDPESRKTLIEQAGRAIFSHTSTGFLNKSNNEFTPYSPVLTETLKALKDK